MMEEIDLGSVKAEIDENGGVHFSHEEGELSISPWAMNEIESARQEILESED